MIRIAGAITRYLNQRSENSETRSPRFGPPAVLRTVMPWIFETQRRDRPGQRRHTSGRRRSRARLKSLRIGVRLAGPVLVGGALLVDADLLGQRVPLSGHVVQDLLARLARPKAGHRLPQDFLVLVDLQQREIEQAGIGTGAQRLEVFWS